MATKKRALPSGVTEEMIKAWKEEHGDLKIIKVRDADDPTIEYSCVTKRYIASAIFSKVMRALGSSDLAKAASLALQNTWLGGDEQIKKDHRAEFSAGSEVMKDLSKFEGESENL